MSFWAARIGSRSTASGIHYPSGQGATVLEFCHKNLTSKKGLKKFKDAVNKAYFVPDEEYQAMYVG